jgi:hypothetical protein
LEPVLRPHHPFPDTIDHILGLFHPPLGIVEGGQKPTPASNRIKNFQHPFTLCNRCVTSEIDATYDEDMQELKKFVAPVVVIGVALAVFIASATRI